MFYRIEQVPSAIIELLIGDKSLHFRTPGPIQAPHSHDLLHTESAKHFFDKVVGKVCESVY